MCEKGLRFTELHGTLFLCGKINIFDIQVYQEKKQVFAQNIAPRIDISPS